MYWGLGNLLWGCSHWGMEWGHLKGPSGHLLARGWSSRGGGDGGARVLPLSLLPDRVEWWGLEFV